MPTFGDFTPAGQQQAGAWYKSAIGGLHSSVSDAAANANSRVEGWTSKNPDKPLNQYASGEARRAKYTGQMAEDPGIRDRSSFGLSEAGHRIAGNWGRAAALTARGDIAPTEHDVGAANLTSHTEAGMKALQTGRGTAQPVGADWYFDHGPGIAKAAEAFGADPRAAIISSTSMSPQNSPQNERQASSALARMETQNPMIHVATDVKGSGALKGASIAAGSHEWSSLNPDQISLINRNAVNPKYPKTHGNPITTDKVNTVMRDMGRGTISADQAERESDLSGLGKGGTELATGVRMMRGETGQQDLGPTGKVTTYTHNSLLAAGLDSLGEKGADANDRAEFHRRVHEATPGSAPYFEQDTLFGKEWEADPYGRAHVTTGMLNVGHQPDSPIPASDSAKAMYPDSHDRHINHMMEHQGVSKPEDVVLPEGSATMDTWQMGQSVGLPRSVEHKDLSGEGGRHTVHAAKTIGSDSAIVDPGAAGYMPTAKGQRNLSSSEAQHAIFNEVNNRAAAEISNNARAAGRNVGAGLPIIALQSATWTGYRIEGGKDPHFDARTAANNAPAERGIRETQRGTPQPGENVPMFDASNEPINYGGKDRSKLTWKASKSKAPLVQPAKPFKGGL
jgi:hypothetical protein